MNSPTRLEVDAAIDALEGRIDRRLQTLEKKIDHLIVHFDERLARFEERMTRFEERMTRVEIDCRETRNIASSLKLTIITTALASVIAIIIGFSAITTTIHANMLSAFTSGRDEATLQERIRRQAEETDAILRGIRKDLDTASRSAG